MKGLFGKPKEPEPPVTMPDENDPALMASERRRRSSQVMRGGRNSTLLSGAGVGSGQQDEYTSGKMG